MVLCTYILQLIIEADLHTCTVLVVQSVYVAQFGSDVANI